MRRWLVYHDGDGDFTVAVSVVADTAEDAKRIAVAMDEQTGDGRLVDWAHGELCAVPVSKHGAGYVTVLMPREDHSVIGPMGANPIVARFGV